MIERKYCYGISLIEILVVVVAIANIPAILYPVLTSDRGQSFTQICVSNQRQIAEKLQIYAQDHEDTLPLSEIMWHDIYIDPKVTICPQDKKNPIGYLFNNNLSGIALENITNPKKTLATIDGKTTIGINRSTDDVYYTPTDVLFRHYDRKKNMYWAVASFTDGHIELVNKVTEPESWDKQWP